MRMAGSRLSAVTESHAESGREALDFGLAVAFHGYFAAGDAVPDGPPDDYATPAPPADSKNIHLLTHDFNFLSSISSN